MKAKLSIYAICFNMLIYLVLSVSIAGAVASFPGVDPTVVQYLITVPSLACIVGTFLVPFLGTKLSQKTLSAGAQAISLVGAAMYILFPTNLPLLFVASVILGLAYGVLSTTFPLLVNIHVAEGQRNKVMGIASGMVQFGRLASLMVAGFLGDIKWNYVYFTYVFVLIAFCYLVPCLPPDKPIAKPSGTGKNSYGAFFRDPAIWEIAILDFLFGVLYFVISTHLSLYIEGYGLGTASTTGLISSLTCGLAGIVACLFAPIYKITGRYSGLFVFSMLAVGFIVSGLWVSMAGIVIGALCATVAAAVFTPYILAYCTEVTTPETNPMAVSIAVGCLSVGFFIAPAVANTVSGVLADGSPASVYLINGIGAAICAVVILVIKTRKKAN